MLKNEEEKNQSVRIHYNTFFAIIERKKYIKKQKYLLPVERKDKIIHPGKDTGTDPDSLFILLSKIFES